MIKDENGILRNDSNYRVTLRSYGGNKNKTGHHLLTIVDIECENFKTFQTIVDLVNVVLEKENELEK